MMEANWIDMRDMHTLELVQLTRTGRWTCPRRKLPSKRQTDR